MSEAPEYAAWLHMRSRCNLESHPWYKNYGARGIRVCQRWEGSFEAFFTDMGPRPSAEHTLERKDNNLGYEPGNCIWATRTAQSRNKRNNRIVVFRGRPMTLAEACADAGLPYNTVAQRLHKGWDEQRALTEPIWSPSRARRSPIFVDFLGQRLPLAEACSLAGLPYATVLARLKAGRSPNDALTTPIRGSRK